MGKSLSSTRINAPIKEIKLTGTIPYMKITKSRHGFVLRIPNNVQGTTWVTPFVNIHKMMRGKRQFIYFTKFKSRAQLSLEKKKKRV